MGSKGNKTQTQQAQTYTPDPRIQQAGYQALSGAQSAAAQPFQMPVAPIAGFTPFQQQAFGATQNQLGMAQPYFGMGSMYLQGSAQPVSGENIAGFYNPMASNVLGNLQDLFGQQMRQTTGQATQAAGGVGADRIGVTQANLAKQQGLAYGQTASQLWQQALQAAQQQKQMMAGAGFGLGQFGPAAQAAQLQSIGALGAAGAQQQQLAQAQLNAPYQNILAQIAYPFQTAQYLAGITGGLAPALGGTTAGAGTTTYPTPSPLNQALGIGTSLIGLGGQAGMFGGTGGKGGGAGYGATYGATDLGGFGMGSYGGAPVPTFFKRGGKIRRYADGGGPMGSQDDSSMVSPLPEVTLPKTGGLSPIPYIQLQPGSGEIHNKLNLNPPQQGGGDSGGSALGSVAKIAATVLPFFLARGGGVNPMDVGESFQYGGDTGDDPYGVGNPALYGDYPAQPHLGASDVMGAAADYMRMPESDRTSMANASNWLPRSMQPFSEAQATPAPMATAPAPAQPAIDIPYETTSANAMPMSTDVMPMARPAQESPFSHDNPPLTPAQIRQEAIFAANKYGVPVNTALRLFNRESGFRPDVRGAAGEIGPGQIMPGTARELGIDPRNTYANIHGAMQYLRNNYDRFGDWRSAVAAYNAGPGAVASGRIPASTRDYVADVMKDQPPGEIAMSARQATPGSYVNPMGPVGADSIQMPDSMRPYPGARQQDWGQTAARSPWMALVKAGAAMASTSGPIGTAIGKGIAAGAGELETQRKDLRSEEEINQKAQSLYQQAQIHLNQYQRMTPYQQEEVRLREQALAQGRYTPVNLEVDDEKGNPKVIAARFNPRTGQYEDASTGQPVSGRLIARQTGAESATSRANIAFRAAKDDPEYQTDQIGTINKHRALNGLQPLGAHQLGTSKETAIPDPGEGHRTPGTWYVDKDGTPRLWK